MFDREAAFILVSFQRNGSVRRLCRDLDRGRLLLHFCNDSRSVFRYLAKNSAALFSASDYEVAPPEYHRKAV